MGHIQGSVLLKKLWVKIGLMMAAAVLMLVACGGDAGAGDPGAAVVDYFQAKVDGDRARLGQLLCAEREGDLDQEAMSFDGVEARLEEVGCIANAAEGETPESVTCIGAIMAVYGGEDTAFPLGTYRVTQEAGEWRWCGEVAP